MTPIWPDGPVPVNRHVLTVDLRDDPAAIASYREHHRRVWPEVIHSLREAGVERMDIHLLGRRLVMIVELRSGLDCERTFAAHAASSPRVVEWERLMKSLQESAPDSPPGEWWALMEPVFSLEPERTAARASDRPSRPRTGRR
jgi:L-rhamnose mutarotase